MFCNFIAIRFCGVLGQLLVFLPTRWLFFLHYLTITTIHGNVGNYSPNDMTPNGQKG